MSKWNRPCRLKKEARPFFKEELARSVMDFDNWKELKVDENALDEVEEVFITYGNKRYPKYASYENIYEEFGMWCNPDNDEYKKNGEAGATLCFSMHFPSCKWEEHDRFMKGRMVAGLMDRLQTEADNYFKQFVSDELDDNGQIIKD